MIAISFAIIIMIFVFVSVMFAKLHGESFIGYVAGFMMLFAFGSVFFHLGKKYQIEECKIDAEKTQRCLPLTYNKDLEACVDINSIQKLEE